MYLLFKCISPTTYSKVDHSQESMQVPLGNKNHSFQHFHMCHKGMEGNCEYIPNKWKRQKSHHLLHSSNTLPSSSAKDKKETDKIFGFSQKCHLLPVPACAFVQTCRCCGVLYHLADDRCPMLTSVMHSPMVHMIDVLCSHLIHSPMVHMIDVLCSHLWYTVQWYTYVRCPMLTPDTQSNGTHDRCLMLTPVIHCPMVHIW